MTRDLDYYLGRIHGIVLITQIDLAVTALQAIRELDEALDYALACHIEWAIRAPIEDVR